MRLLTILAFATISDSSIVHAQFENPLEFKTVIVQVYDSFTGESISGAPVAMEGHSRMVLTDEEGYAAITYGGSPDPEVKTFWSSPAGKTIGYADLTVDSSYEVVRLGVAPAGMYTTPLIASEVGGTFVLSGPVVQGGPADFWMELSVPAYSLPANGYLSVSPRPHNSIRHSGGYRFDGIGEVSYCLADYSIAFIDSGGTRIENPTLAAPIAVTTKSWCQVPQGSWGGLEPENVQLLTLDYNTKQLVLHSPQPVLIDAGAKTKTFYLDHLSTWRERAFWVNSVGKPIGQAWDDFTSWLTGSASSSPAPPAAPVVPTPDTPQPDNGPVPAIGLLDLSVTEFCETGNSVNVSCGRYTSNANEECINDGTFKISSEIMEAAKVELGVDNGLVSAITGASGKIGLELSATQKGEITIGAAQVSSAGFSQGGYASYSPTGTCLSGSATIMRVKKKITMSTAVGVYELPLPPCIRLAKTFQLGFNPQDACHWSSPDGTTNDCTASTPLPSVPNQVDC